MRYFAIAAMGKKLSLIFLLLVVRILQRNVFRICLQSGLRSREPWFSIHYKQV